MGPKGHYAALLQRLESAGRLGSKPGLSRIRKLCSLLKNPQKKFKSIIVAGTNGKGSTVAMLSSILKDGKHKAGSYYSPHVFDFCERVQINGKKISRAEFANALGKVFGAIDKNADYFSDDAPSFFEIVTAAAFLYFAKKRVDYAVLEVGMGGRLDATNICNADLCIISSIGMDHTQFLGESIEEIAYEKAGIAKKGKWLVVANGIPINARNTIISHARSAGAKIAMPATFDAFAAVNAKLLLAGEFQLKNAATAACAARLLGITPRTMISGLPKATLPARLQQISSSPKIILDCAHNPDGANALAASLVPVIGASRPRILLFSSMKDKGYARELEALRARFDAIVVFSPPLPRAESASMLAAAAKDSKFKKIIMEGTPASAFARAKSEAGKKGAVVACGSMYSFQYLLGTPALALSQ